MGHHFLLQGIFPTQGSNLGLLYYRPILYRLSYKGSPFVMETREQNVRLGQLSCPLLPPFSCTDFTQYYAFKKPHV